MSIILRNYPTSLNSIGGGSEEGFPPGDVTIISTTVNDGQVLIKWSDPEDTIINGSTISTWAGTILVRKQGSYPSSIEDGTVVVDNTTKNAYRDTWYKDMGLTNNMEYYYRFFPYSTEGVYNNSGNLVFKATPVGVAPIFSDNTWEQIISASESDTIPDTWNVGDKISLKLSGTYNLDVELQIWGFKHFDKSDGSGKAGLLLGCERIPMQEMMNYNMTSEGGWPEYDMSKTVMENIYNSIPDNIKTHIKEVNIKYDNGYPDFSIKTFKDKIFIPSLREVGISNRLADGTKFDIFTDDNSRKKKMINSESYDNWWTRSNNKPYNASVININFLGTYIYIDISTNLGCVFCFNI